MTGQPSHRFDLAVVETDTEALARIGRGDLGALGALYDRHYLAVLRFIQRVTRDPTEAEDLAQEVFLTAARIAGTFDGRPSCRPWLYGIAARHVLHRHRTLARCSRFLHRLGEQLSGAKDETPQESAMRRELGGELEQALAKLSPEKRVVIILAEVEELTCEEIAQSLGIPVGTVWTRLHHARRALRQRLERRGP